LRLKRKLRHVVILTHKLDRSLLWVSDLEHWIRNGCFLLALLTQVVVASDWAFVSDTSNRSLVAPIANDSLVDYLSLSKLLLLEVLGKQFLVLTCAVFADFFSENLLEILKEFVSEPSGTVTLLAWESLFVHLLAVTSEAFWWGAVVRTRWVDLEVVRSYEHAACLLLVTNDLLLASLRLSVYLGAAANVLRLGSGLRGCFTVLNGSSNRYILDFLNSVASEAVWGSFLLNQILDHVSGIYRLSWCLSVVNPFITSTGDWVWSSQILLSLSFHDRFFTNFLGYCFSVLLHFLLVLNSKVAHEIEWPLTDVIESWELVSKSLGVHSIQEIVLSLSVKIAFSLEWWLLNWWDMWWSVSWSLGNSAGGLEHLLKHVSEVFELSWTTRWWLADRDWLVECRIAKSLSSLFVSWCNN